MKIPTKIVLLTLIAGTTLAVPAWLQAQDASTNAPSSSDTTPAPKHKHGGMPFHGTVDGVDTNAMTLTVGSRTFQITSTTHVFNNGQPVMLVDATVGEPVTGSYKADPNNTNTLDAVKVNLGKGKGRKHKASSDSDSSSSMTSTNSTTGN